jgi:hypothetical protein
MDCRKDQIILIQQRHTGLIACGIRRIECEVGEEPLAGWVARRDLFKLYKVRLPNGGVLINAFEVRFKRSDASHFFMCAVESATKRRETADFDRPDPAGDGTCPSGGNDQSSPEEKIILLGLPDGLRQCWQIRTLPRVQRDEFLLCTSKFESDMASHAVGLNDVREELPAALKYSHTTAMASSELRRALRVRRHA